MQINRRNFLRQIGLAIGSLFAGSSLVAMLTSCKEKQAYIAVEVIFNGESRTKSLPADSTALAAIMAAFDCEFQQGKTVYDSYTTVNKTRGHFAYYVDGIKSRIWAGDFVLKKDSVIILEKF